MAWAVTGLTEEVRIVVRDLVGCHGRGCVVVAGPRLRPRMRSERERESRRELHAQSVPTMG
eukprot:3155218-Prymnesium_polylepis.1